MIGKTYHYRNSPLIAFTVRSVPDDKVVIGTLNISGRVVGRLKVKTQDLRNPSYWNEHE